MGVGPQSVEMCFTLSGDNNRFPKVIPPVPKGHLELGSLDWLMESWPIGRVLRSFCGMGETW